MAAMLCFVLHPSPVFTGEGLGERALLVFGMASHALMFCVAPPRARHFFLLARGGRPEKVTKKKGTPASGSRCARLPSLRHCSGDRRTWAIPGPLRLSPHPCGSSPSAVPALGLLTGDLARGWKCVVSELERTRKRIFRRTKANSPLNGLLYVRSSFTVAASSSFCGLSFARSTLLARSSRFPGRDKNRIAPRTLSDLSVDLCRISSAFSR